MKTFKKILTAGGLVLLCCLVPIMMCLFYACTPFLVLAGGMAYEEATSGELSQEETKDLVLEHKTELDAYMAAGDFSALPEIKGLHEDVQHISGSLDTCVSVYCGGSGFGPHCQYWGFVYYPPGHPLHWIDHSFAATEETVDFTSGGNEFHLEKIVDRYYFYYEAY